MDDKKLVEEIKKWKKKRGALILAHNYQIPAIQDVADFIGDSLELSKQAARSSEKLIVFCGVHFMAESAAIFSPEKTILIPDLGAGCSLAASIDADELRRWKAKYPDAMVVSYVNTTAEVKAESDYCCTSTNAVAVVNAIPKNKRILFVPDMFLGTYVQKMTGRDLIIYPGECHVHARVRPEDILGKMKKSPETDFLIHPECGCVSNCMHFVANGDIPADKTHILSTGGMLKYAQKSKKTDFIVATETGIIHRLEKQNPKKNFAPLRDDMVCQFMKMITLPKLLNSLINLEFEVKVPKEIADKARVPIERMFAVSK
ncbi:quinolinate synthase [Candidatus Roizmanbacteria bacterium CG_4_9_14_3_um_filter_33_18]|uniref:Quinolinate synthase n=3 Tax=Candidatus Roizmaniibacteriota TaxID=1752723 RepID=A0A2M7UB33_9BACT|nr:MAG: quinolinate synthase [Candidatus Roizmanbacteria bacterium CG22_combo_CG10-13_8_21_14_all_34_12]PIZ68444.1 MAG: quinolinate synthase [Candidatus Roizmanbacteria bacterium CG_4_10_14_0_2_um_filter_33_96]PJA55805.1 MAG: quinolinate synthase [Candidatus Roizmanbacteria bacterium CG_4_9_14_3_um_filter_33_18]